MQFGNSTLTATLISTLAFLAQSNGAPHDTPFDFPTPFIPASQLKAATSTLPTKVGFPIHPSCNPSQAATLRYAFSELQSVASAASNHILVHGSHDPLFIKYFGKGADQSIPEATYNRIVNGDKKKLLFRCDDPDHQCAKHPDWNGHWRDQKAKGETVICKLSFKSRLGLDKVCRAGVKDINSYWALDLIHRSLHLPAISQGNAQSFAEGYSDLLQLAQKDPKKSVKNADTLQAFAFEVISRNPKHPKGCVEELQGHVNNVNTTAELPTSPSVVQNPSN